MGGLPTSTLVRLCCASRGFRDDHACGKLAATMTKPDLATSFSIDPAADWVQAHNAEAREVLAAHKADKPIRVPVIGDDYPHMHGFYVDEIDMDYREYYTDVEVMLHVQLEAARRRAELCIYDRPLGELPDSWGVVVDQHPVQTPGWLGCELLYREDSVIAHRHLDLSKDQCIAMEMPDVRTGGHLKVVGEMLEEMTALAEGMTYLGRPVGPVWNGVMWHGLLNVALDIRGQDLMVDMYEDPEFAHAFLLKVATWCDALEREWGENEPGAFHFSDHGIEMLSPAIYEEFIVPVIHEMNRRRGDKTPWPYLHHCGSGTHLFPIMQREFGLVEIGALTWPLVDIAKVRRDLGEDVWIYASVADEIVKFGTPDSIYAAVRELMETGAKGKGRFALGVGDMMRGTPMANREAFYGAVKEFGRY